MNETKETLLQGLGCVKNMLESMQSVLTEYIDLERSFRARQAAIGTSSVKDRSKLLAVTIGGTLAVFYLLSCVLTGDVGSIILLAAAGAVVAVNRGRKSKLKNAALLLLAVSILNVAYRIAISLTVGFAILIVIVMGTVIAAEYFFITGKNRSVAAHNKEVDAHNAQVTAQRTALYERYTALQNELSANAPDWFPPDYYNMEAVDFFISVVRNSRADTVKEMVNLFESTAQHQEMIAYQRRQTEQLDELISGQQAIRQELRFANMMHVANYIQLAGINSGVRNLNSQAGAIRQGVNRLNDTAGRIASDTRQISSDVYKIRKGR